ncbi:MAG: hypothetical protein DMF60_18390, partial [Acidobacteria bacterium]
KRGMGVAMPASFTPVVLILIILGSAAGGYWWYADLTNQSLALDDSIRSLEATKKTLEATIKADELAEARKKLLDNKINIIKGLQNNQVSPVLALDQLAEAVEKTQYVWLSSLDQKDAVLNMSGIGTSLNAVADFYSNLNATGYFRNIDLGPSQESGGNFTFSLRCEFSPPRNLPATAPRAAGGN